MQLSRVGIGGPISERHRGSDCRPHLAAAEYISGVRAGLNAGGVMAGDRRVTEADVQCGATVGQGGAALHHPHRKNTVKHGTKDADVGMWGKRPPSNKNLSTYCNNHYCHCSTDLGITSNNKQSEKCLVTSESAPHPHGSYISP